MSELGATVAWIVGTVIVTTLLLILGVEFWFALTTACWVGGLGGGILYTNWEFGKFPFSKSHR